MFSALESDAAKAIEPTLAAHVPVFSTASAYRYEPDVPILVPGVNPEHAELLRLQQRRRGWRGFIAPGPNCTATGLVICLRPLHEAFGLSRVIMTSLQAVSGRAARRAFWPWTSSTTSSPTSPKKKKRSSSRRARSSVAATSLRRGSDRRGGD